MSSNTPFPGMRLGLSTALGLRQVQEQYHATREQIETFAATAASAGVLSDGEIAQVRGLLDRAETLVVEAAMVAGLDVPEVSQ